MRRFLVDLLKATGYYLLVVLGGTVLLLIGATLLGYLPYSDRPGPGWYGWRWSITIREIGFFVSWPLLALAPGAVFGALLFLAVQLLQWIHAPRQLTQTIGAVVSGIASLVLVSGAGWYIAISAIPVYGAGLLGCLYGGWLLPRHVTNSPAPHDLSPKQKLTIFGVWCLGAAWVLLPIITRPSCEADQTLAVVLVQWRTGPESLTEPKGRLYSEELARLKATGATGQLIVNSTLISKAGDGAARAVIVMQRPFESPVELRQPDGTTVIHLQDATGWKMIPPDAPTRREGIRLTSAQEDPAQIRVEAKQACHTLSGGTYFNW